MSGTRHLSTNPGKRVRLVLRNGDTVDGRFIKQDGAFVHLDGPRLFRAEKIRTMIVNPRIWGAAK